MVTHVPAEARGDERGALLSFVEAQRGAIRRSLIGLTEEQAAVSPAPVDSPSPGCSSMSPRPS